MLKALRKRIRLGGRGFTLVEMMVVLAIMAVMAAIVFSGVTGSTTTSREATQPMDINAVQTGVDRLNADDTDGLPWPTKVSIPAGEWVAGELPSPTVPVSGAGTDGDPYIFDYDHIAGIDWDSDATANGDSRDFFPYYLRSKPDYSADTITVANTESSAVFKIRKGGEDVYVQLTNTSGVSIDYLTWGVDEFGGVWVFVNAASY